MSPVDLWKDKIYFFERGNFMSLFQNATIKSKFKLLTILLSILVFISIWGMFELAQTRHLQKLERDHVEYATVLNFRIEEYLSLQDYETEYDQARADKLINAQSAEAIKMGILQLATKAADLAQAVDDDTYFFEKIIFRILGFGAAFDLAAKDIIDMNTIKDVIQKHENNSISFERLSETVLEYKQKIINNSKEFATIIQDASIFVRNLMMTLAIILSSLTIFVLMTVSKSIIEPMNRAVEFAQDIENGDFTTELNLDRADEIGALTSALDNMAGKLRKIMHNLKENSDNLNITADELNNSSVEGRSLAEALNEKSTSVAAATEEISANMSAISAAAEQSSTNINVVASSSEEMSATVSEISETTQNTLRITNDAKSSVGNAASRVNELGNAANAINDVIQVIMEISDQTKLLALNATIEAARAGEAGKGFAVVAQEIKELANQTNSATEEIQGKIEAIQSSTESTIIDINDIEKVMNEVSDMVSGIATAVEEQSATSKDIAANITQAADGVKDMTSNVVQAADALKNTVTDISDISDASGEVKKSSTDLETKSTKLKEAAGEIGDIIARFKV